MTEPHNQLGARQPHAMTEPHNQADTRKPRTITEPHNQPGARDPRTITESQSQPDARAPHAMIEPQKQSNARKPRTIARSDVQDMLALTPMQEGMLLQELRQPGEAAYKVQFLVRLEGEVVTETFREAWRQVAASTEMLRTLFRWEGLSQPVQIVLKRHEPHIVIHDLSGESAPERALAELRRDEQSRGYDLTEPPYRILLCRLTEQRSAMLICNHHILYDGWSTGLLLARFFAAYGAGADKPPADPLPFKAYVQQLQQQDAAAADAYWQAYLDGLEETTRLPWETEEAEQSGERATGTLLLSAGETERLMKAAQQHRVTPATLLFAAWGLLLQRYGMTRDVVFGTTVSGRSPALQGIESMVGLFINTVPLRVRMTETSTIGELLSGVAADLRERAPYETVPLARIQQNGPAPGESLFDSIVVVENYPVDPEAMRSADGGLTVGGYELDEATPYALTLAVTVGERVELTLGSGHARYDSPGIASILTHYRRLLLALADRPERTLAELAMLSAEEREQLIGDRSAPADTSGTIDGRFAEQARRTPQAIAVRSRDGELSYAALAQQADRIARRLRAAGLATEEIVALRLRPSPLIPAALLGILQAGGAYL
ncbi:condensation domain-containing protein, partial [Paenibacillus sp. 598K]|uniref:condensation domain-containing protein n=1 Tax=Paenibacillus sp. 598K TaxID=1117987 RepID=UPI0011CF421F